MPSLKEMNDLNLVSFEVNPHGDDDRPLQTFQIN